MGALKDGVGRRLWRNVVAALVVGIGAPAFTALAEAAPSAGEIRECGGRTSIHNVTARYVTCTTARRYARNAGFIGYGETTFSHPTDDRYSCRVRIPDSRSYTVDVRCTYRFYVIRWQYDSGE